MGKYHKEKGFPHLLMSNKPLEWRTMDAKELHHKLPEELGIVEYVWGYVHHTGWAYAFKPCYYRPPIYNPGRLCVRLSWTKENEQQLMKISTLYKIKGMKAIMYL